MTNLDAPVAAIVSKARIAFDQNLTLTVERRVQLLKALSSALKANVERLVAIADEETHLGVARLTGEVARTCFQLEAFAQYLTDAKHLRAINQPAISSVPPVGRPHLQLTAVALGPVAVFAASNFPFAFSVLGGDTAAALAAGCTVIVKAHPAHPRLSLAVFRIAQSVIFELDLPVDWLSLMNAPGIHNAEELVMHPDLAAVSFTGSLNGGKALAKLIHQRDIPIPFFGELGSVNPVIVLPQFLATHPAEVAHALADSIVQGTGQFCTSPGLIFIDCSKSADAFIQALADRLSIANMHEMLTTGMQLQFDELVARSAKVNALRTLTISQPSEAKPSPTLHEVNLDAFLMHTELREEIFGPYSLVVRIGSGVEGFVEALKGCEGSLTTTFWAAESDKGALHELLPLAMQKAGRILFSGVPTGVAVTEAQQHGGPWPASTRPESTSVGMRAIERFLRPVALQDLPSWLGARS
jgi:acyl-CoA reductase-like NAD-dependent aldehyde dehydrogenase